MRKIPKSLFSGGWEDVVKIWSLKTYSQVGILSNTQAFAGLSFSFDEKLVCVSVEEISIWDTENLTIIKSFKTDDVFFCMALSPEYIIAGANKIK